MWVSQSFDFLPKVRFVCCFSICTNLLLLWKTLVLFVGQLQNFNSIHLWVLLLKHSVLLLIENGVWRTWSFQAFSVYLSTVQQVISLQMINITGRQMDCNNIFICSLLTRARKKPYKPHVSLQPISCIFGMSAFSLTFKLSCLKGLSIATSASLISSERVRIFRIYPEKPTSCFTDTIWSLHAWFCVNKIRKQIV